MKIYKYTTFETLVKILLSEKIRFSSVTTFNDPFEFQFTVKEDKHNHKEYFKRHLNYKCGVFCGSLAENNILMLSHYANHHKGWMIEFELDTKYAGKRGLAVIDLNRYGEKDMCFGYGAPIPDLSNFLNKLRPDTLPPEDEIEKAAFSIVGTKHIDWKYEKEIRFLISWNKDKLYEDIAFKDCGLKIVRLSYGCRTSDEDKKNISEMLRIKYNNVNIFPSIDYETYQI